MASRGLPANAEIQSSLMILELRTALEATALCHQSAAACSGPTISQALSERLGDQSFGKGLRASELTCLFRASCPLLLGGDKQAGSDREDRT